MKIGFLGTPQISAHVLEELAASAYKVCWVASQPDKKSGRGLKTHFTPVKEKALSLGIPVLQSPVFSREFFEEIKKHGEIDLAVVVAYGLYIPAYFVLYPKFSCLNIHLSLLPLYRGAAPVARAIMDGKVKSGISLMKIAKEMDTGDIVASMEHEIDLMDTTESLTWTLIKKGTTLLIETIPSYINEKITPIQQNQTGVTPTYAEKISKEDAIIDWNKDAVSIHNRIRALYPWPGVTVKIESLDVKISKTFPIDFQTQMPPASIVDISVSSNNMLIQTGKGCLLVEKVQPSGKKEMSVLDFVNGHRIKKGMRII